MRAIANDTRKAGVRSILMSDSTATDHPRNAFKEILKRRLLRRLYDGALCSGTRARSYLQSLGFRDEMIWNGVDAVDNEHFSMNADLARSDDSHRKRLGLPDEYILCVSRHSPEKNPQILLDAYARISREQENCSLVYCGTGPLTKELRSKAEMLGISGKVHFAGWASYENMPYYYALAKVSVLCSRSETWGLVVNESLAAGTPAIVSDRCGCIPELIRRGVSGYTFRSGDSGDLVKALHLCLGGALGKNIVRQCRSIVAPWSIRNQTLGIVACLAAFGAIRKADVKRKDV
jgi:glycosyltransferase involved in cell wall biosynthesis